MTQFMKIRVGREASIGDIDTMSTQELYESQRRFKLAEELAYSEYSNYNRLADQAWDMYRAAGKAAEEFQRAYLVRSRQDKLGGSDSDTHVSTS